MGDVNSSQRTDGRNEFRGASAGTAVHCCQGKEMEIKARVKNPTASVRHLPHPRMSHFITMTSLISPSIKRKMHFRVDPLASHLKEEGMGQLLLSLICKHLAWTEAIAPALCFVMLSRQIQTSSSAIWCHWHEQIDYMPQVLKWTVLFIYQTFVKIIKNLPQCIFHLKSYNPTTFFHILWLLIHRRLIYGQDELWEAYLCSLISSRNYGELPESKYHCTQSAHVVQSAIPSGVSHFTPWVISPTAVSHLYHSFDYWNQPFQFDWRNWIFPKHT